MEAVEHSETPKPLPAYSEPRQKPGSGNGVQPSTFNLSLYWDGSGIGIDSQNCFIGGGDSGGFGCGNPYDNGAGTGAGTGQGEGIGSGWGDSHGGGDGYDESDD